MLGGHVHVVFGIELRLLHGEPELSPLSDLHSPSNVSLKRKIRSLLLTTFSVAFGLFRSENSDLANGRPGKSTYQSVRSTILFPSVACLCSLKASKIVEN